VAISVLDVRDTFAPAYAPVASRPAVVDAPGTAGRRLPLTVVAVALVGIAEAIALLAAALTGLDGVLTSPVRPSGWLVAGGLVLLAGWIVLSAGGGAAMVDGGGRKLVLGVSFAELVLVATLTVVGAATPLFAGAPLPLPALAVLAFAVPIGKLLLAGSPSAVQWVAAGPRRRDLRPDPVSAHRLLCTLTIAGIGLALGVLTMLVPAQGSAPAAPVADVVSQH